MPNLTRDISAVRNREHWKQEFALADALTTRIEAFVQTIQVKHGDKLGVVLVSLLLRLCYALEALSLLAARGYVTEATAQFRSLMEAAVKLAALQAKPELLGDYMMQDQLFRKRMLSDVLDAYNEPPRESWRLQLLREWSHEQVEAVFPRGA